MSLGVKRFPSLDRHLLVVNLEDGPIGPQSPAEPDLLTRHAPRVGIELRAPAEVSPQTDFFNLLAGFVDALFDDWPAQ